MRGGKAAEMMRRSRQAIKSKSIEKSFDLLKVIQSEITHELSSPCFQNLQTCLPEDFTLESDDPHTQDITLRKKCETGEEVAVSALLGSYFAEDVHPQGVMMKVCMRKPGLSSFLQFDCGVSNEFDGHPPSFNIISARYHQSSSSIGLKYYTGPIFSDLDPRLQAVFKECLEERGIGQSFINFLLQHMQNKEQNQYINWLQKLKETVS